MYRLTGTTMRWLLFVVSILCVHAHASDVAKEKRWADQVVDAILDGEAVWLKADGHEFLTIYTEAETDSSKGIIVVHGTGVHPDWEQVVKPVRVEMITRGWHTLSIQVPILHNEASYEEYVPLYPEVPARFQAAEQFFKSRGIEKIVVVAHSQGATMAAYHLANSKHSIQAFVAVGVQATQQDPHINAANSLTAINIPVLDLYGSEDLKGVLDTAQMRKLASTQNSGYAQQVIRGAEHFFDDKNDELIEAIDGWLNSLN